MVSKMCSVRGVCLVMSVTNNKCQKEVFSYLKQLFGNGLGDVTFQWARLHANPGYPNTWDFKCLIKTAM
jgi:hypothetical protein